MNQVGLLVILLFTTTIIGFVELCSIVYMDGESEYQQRIYKKNCEEARGIAIFSNDDKAYCFKNDSSIIIQIP